MWRYDPQTGELLVPEQASTDPVLLQSYASAISFPASENQTRSEFAQESDINWLIDRYGSVPPAQRQLQYGGLTNFDADLTTAFEAIERAKEAHDALPPKVKEMYPSWQLLALEIARGDANPALGEELAEALKAKARKDKADAAAASSSAAAAAASTSDSASGN